MNAEFHYYALYYLCLRSGLPADRARSVAASSQRVDEATAACSIDGGAYRTIATQDYAFWDESTLRDIYLPFHFLPRCAEGPAGSRWAAGPDSPIAKELLVAALRSRDDCRIGIALHAYADGWAHQNFSGRLEPANAVDPSSPLPPVGHLQALRAPDDPGGSWEDPRLGPGSALVRNAERFLAAARMIYRYLRTSLRLGFEDEELALEPLARLWSGPPREARERVADYAIELDVPPYDRGEWLALAGLPRGERDGDPFVGYERRAWLSSGLRAASSLAREPKALDSGGRFAGSPLHRWDLAAREHLQAARELLARKGCI